MSTTQTPLASARPRRLGTRDLRLTLRIAAKPEEVYRALTSARELCRWWLSGAETDARNAGRYRMVWPRIKGKNGSRSFPAAAFRECEGHFVDLEPGRKVAWMWKLPRRRMIFPPLSSFFIRPLKRGCEVTLLHAGFPKSPSADKYYQGCALGWEDCLAKLKLYLETGKACKSQILDFVRMRSLKRGSGGA